MTIVVAAAGLAVLAAGCSSTRRVAPPAYGFLAAEPEPAPHAEAEGVEELEKHKASVFTGWITERGDGGGLAIGVDYEYRINQALGVGGIADYVAGDLDSFLFGVGAFIHPIDNLVVVVAPAVELTDGRGRFALRVGGSYEFELGKGFTIGPALYVDILEGIDVALVMGADISYGW
jgi:hypothetical protein